IRDFHVTGVQTCALPIYRDPVALFGGGLSRRDEAVGKPRAVVLGELQDPVLLVAEQMVAEARAKISQTLIDLGHPRLALLGEAGAGAVEAGIGALQEPLLLCTEL